VAGLPPSERFAVCIAIRFSRELMLCCVLMNKLEKYHHQTQRMGTSPNYGCHGNTFTSGQQNVLFICTTKPKPVSGSNRKPVWQIDYALR